MCDDDQSEFLRLNVSTANYTRCEQQQGMQMAAGPDLGLEDLSDVAARQVGHALKVAALCLGCTDFSREGACKVAEKQILPSHRQAKQPVQEPPAQTHHRPMCMQEETAAADSPASLSQQQNGC